MQSKLIKKIKPIANEYNCKIIASLDVCPTYINNHDIYRSDLEKILEAGPDLLEQTPCPYGHSTPIPFNIEKVEEIHYIAKEEAGIPTIMASAWELLGMRINEYKKHGIKHIHMKSAFFGTAIDIETMKPIVPGPFVMTYGSLRRFGQNLAVAQAKNADFELICSGGVWTAYDCLEKLMCGASLVAIHTAIQYHGHKLFTEIIKGISEYLDRKNCVISDIIGTAVNDIIDVKMHDEFARQHDVPARDLEINIDITRCTSCGLCENCIHGGITIHNDVPIWKNEFCERCGICESICPTEAITITKLGDKNEI
jgi:ferredoxin